MKINWIVEPSILNGDERMLDSIRRSNSGLCIVDTKTTTFPWSTDEPVVLYGSINWLRRCKTSYVPGAYGFIDNMKCSNYYPHIPVDWLLNGRHMMLSFGIVQQCVEELLEQFDGEFFIRPNSQYKIFTGQTINSENYETELNSIVRLTSVMPETICMLSHQREILGEYRFLIVNHEVVAQSEYRWDDQPCNGPIPNECLRLAKEMSRHEYQPDVAYTCDVAMTLIGPRIVELNSFASAGLYNMDTDVVVDRINLAANLEWRE